MLASIVTFVGIILFSSIMQSDFLDAQKKYQRVKDAIEEKEALIEKKLNKNQIKLNNINLLLVAYKDNDLLDIYAKTKQDDNYKKIQSYKICARSGQLGPKRKEGDVQVPEGFYYIDRFNPMSNFYLSLGINYPNQSDIKKSKFDNLGGDIFIHGSCATVGCLPMTDNIIKEIYLLAMHAKNNGQQKIPVYIFPFKMTDKNMTYYTTKYKNDNELISFWENLKTGHDIFIEEQKELSININNNGDYSF